MNISEAGSSPGGSQARCKGSSCGKSLLHSLAARTALFISLCIATGIVLLVIDCKLPSGLNRFKIKRFKVNPREDAWSAEVPWTLCSAETGTGSERHDMFLSRLANRRVVFVGDSLLRCATHASICCRHRFILVPASH
jgi:hypothetical protein